MAVVAAPNPSVSRAAASVAVCCVPNLARTSVRTMIAVAHIGSTIGVRGRPTAGAARPAPARRGICAAAPPEGAGALDAVFLPLQPAILSEQKQVDLPVPVAVESKISAASDWIRRHLVVARGSVPLVPPTPVPTPRQIKVKAASGELSLGTSWHPALADNCFP